MKAKPAAPSDDKTSEADSTAARNAAAAVDADAENEVEVFLFFATSEHGIFMQGLLYHLMIHFNILYWIVIINQFIVLFVAMIFTLDNRKRCLC